MITVLAAFAALAVVTIVVRSQRGARRRCSVHVLAISTALLVFALARAASSRGLTECALDLAATPNQAIAKVHR